jgi:YHS domain-containing protein
MMGSTIVSRRVLLAGLAAALVAGTPPAMALDPVFSRGGKAIRGYDPVAYFTEGRPVQGKAEHSAEWMGAEWRFASAANRDLFVAQPEHYAPQYGGYCAWAVSEGYTASIDPYAWRIVDGKLYLNFSKSVQKRWEQDIPGNIARADRNWPGLRDEG